jgi:hypothetical protein
MRARSDKGIGGHEERHVKAKLKCNYATGCNFAGMNELDRIPVGFKTQAEGNTYRHIVLVIKHRPTNTYGALGLSRRTELMYKELKYTTLAAVLTDYKTSYEGWWHKVEKMRVGLAVTHDTFSNNPICWRYFCYKARSGTQDLLIWLFQWEGISHGPSTELLWLLRVHRLHFGQCC